MQIYIAPFDEKQIRGDPDPANPTIIEWNDLKPFTEMRQNRRLQGSLLQKRLADNNKTVRGGGTTTMRRRAGKSMVMDGRHQNA